MKLKLWWKWRKEPQKGPAPLSFVTLVAPQHPFLSAVIRSYYPIAQEIILGLDKDRITLTGNPFKFDTSRFLKMVRSLDPEGKIQVVEGNFHRHAYPMDNDTEERNFLAKKCRKGNWIIQIDDDEILMNPGEFKDWIDAGEGSGMLLAHWLLVYKKFGDDLLVVDKENHLHAVGTRLWGGYIGSRHTGQNKKVSPLRLFHFAYGRTAEQVKFKLKNWGHSKDFDTDRYFKFWKSVTLENYTQFRDLHPLDGPDWPKLKLIRQTRNHLIEDF